MRGGQRGLDQALERRVDVRLGGVGRLGPAVRLGLDALHGEVGALDHAHLDAPPAARVARVRPGRQLLERAVGVGQVGLQHDARVQAGEVRGVQRAPERRQGQLQVGVGLHVEVDEARGRGGVRGAETAARRGHRDALDLGVERDDVELRGHRADLHADVVDVGAGEVTQHALQAPVRLVVAEHRLAQQVHVDLEAPGAPAREVPRKGGVRRGRDDRAGLRTKPRAHQGHHRARQHRGHPGAQRERDAVQRAHRRHAAARDEVGEHVRGARVVDHARHRVGQRDGERGGALPVDQAREARAAQPVGERCRGRPRAARARRPGRRRARRDRLGRQRPRRCPRRPAGSRWWEALRPWSRSWATDAPSATLRIGTTCNRVTHASSSRSRPAWSSRAPVAGKGTVRRQNW